MTCRVKKMNLVEHMMRGMVASGEILPSEIMFAFHNTLAYGELHIDTFGHCNEEWLTKAFVQTHELIDTLKEMEKDFSEK